MADVTGAMVAEEVVEFREGGGDVLLAAAINNIDPLALVGVEKAAGDVPGSFRQCGAAARRLPAIGRPRLRQCW